MSRYKDSDLTLRPVDPETGEALAQRKQPGYYPGFSTLSQSQFWDEATRRAVNKRVENPPERRFFTAYEWNFWEAVFEHLLPQSDRTPDRRIALIPALDHRLHINHTAGYRYESMPQDRDAYRLGMQAIDAESQARYGGDFLNLGHWQQEKVLQAIHDGNPEGAPEIWARMSVSRLWRMILSDAVEAYYAHPWAWDEVGFGGPAYPRAYTRLERGEPEPWEVKERRYDWLPPEASVSDEIEPLGHLHTEADQVAHRSKVRPR